MTPLRSRTRKAADAILILLFAAVVALPGATWLCGLAPASALEENRQLAPFPTWRWQRSAILWFPVGFEAYFNDHFPFRGLLVKSYNRVKARWLEVSPRPDVVIGEQGWLYYRPGLVDLNSPVPPFTEEELTRWTTALEERRQWLQAHGCRFLVIVAPDKDTIYPEHLPRWVRGLPRRSRLDQLLEHVHAHSAVTILDLRQPLLRAKEQERLYFKTDTHWNERGSFVGYQCVAEALTHWFPQVTPLSRLAFAPDAVDTYGGDLAGLLGIPQDYREDKLCLTPLTPLKAHEAKYVPLVPTPAQVPDSQRPVASECEDELLPRAVMFRDSFTNGLKPFLSEHFRRIVYLWQDAFDPAVIEQERPDVVLYEFVERKLTSLVPENTLPAP